MNSSETEISPLKLSSSLQDVVVTVMTMMIVMMMFEEINSSSSALIKAELWLF